eukprot:11349828-Alexandrium_andersonii.AAC.1
MPLSKATEGCHQLHSAHLAAPSAGLSKWRTALRRASAIRARCLALRLAPALEAEAAEAAARA